MVVVRSSFPFLCSGVKYALFPGLFDGATDTYRWYRRRFLQPNTHFSAFFEIYSRPYRAKKSRPAVEALVAKISVDTSGMCL